MSEHSLIHLMQDINSKPTIRALWRSNQITTPCSDLGVQLRVQELGERDFVVLVAQSIELIQRLDALGIDSGLGRKIAENKSAWERVEEDRQVRIRGWDL